jgi:hypothetical protein
MSVRISTEHLFFQAQGRSFFQEASSVPELRERVPRDFTLVSQWTGQEIEMHCKAPRIVHGEIVGWTFRPVDKNAPIRNVVIIND